MNNCDGGDIQYINLEPWQRGENGEEGYLTCCYCPDGPAPTTSTSTTTTTTTTSTTTTGCPWIHCEGLNGSAETGPCGSWIITANNVSNALNFYDEACTTGGGPNSSYTCSYRNHYHPIGDSITVTISQVDCDIENPTGEQIGSAFAGKTRYCGGESEIESLGAGSITLSANTCDGVELGCFEQIDNAARCIEGVTL